MKNMVKIIIIAIVLLTSCNGHSIEPTIYWKAYRTFNGGKMPTGICRYGYKNMSNGRLYEFEDSCNKYEVGQTIKPK